LQTARTVLRVSHSPSAATGRLARQVAQGGAWRCPRRRPFGREVTSLSPTPADSKDEARRFAEGLTSEERMLVVLKRELYEGSWDEMVADLTARLEGRPYIFKLAHRIVDDLQRIQRLREFEQRHGVDLGEFVSLET
jgi:hypothetical protein